MQIIAISSEATGVSYLKAFLWGSCLFTGVCGQFIPSRSSSQLWPLLAVLAETRAAGPPLLPLMSSFLMSSAPAFFSASGVLLILTLCCPPNPHSLENTYSWPILSASINNHGFRQHPSPWNWEWEVDKWLLPQKSEFVRKDNELAVLNKRCEDILLDKAPMNHLGTKVAWPYRPRRIFLNRDAVYQCKQR